MKSLIKQLKEESKTVDWEVIAAGFISGMFFAGIILSMFL